MTTPPKDVEEKIINHLVDRFLGWKLPEDFQPDAGISFERKYNVKYNAREGRPPSIHKPTGTNLFTAEQAKEMFRFLLEKEDGTSILTTHTDKQVEKGWKYIVKATREENWSKAEYIKALTDK